MKALKRSDLHVVTLLFSVGVICYQAESGHHSAPVSQWPMHLSFSADTEAAAVSPKATRVLLIHT